jgi:lipid-binding SYLF domain-containing protein
LVAAKASSWEATLISGMSLCGDKSDELSQVFCGVKEFMTSTNRARAAFFFIVLLTSSAYAATPKQKAEKRLQDAGEVLQQIMNAPDKGIPIEVVQDAKCIAVIPHEIQGGFVFGAKHGRGVATCRTPIGWSAPAFFTINGGSWGLQVGLAGVDNVMMIMNQKGMDRLLSNKFQIGAEASAAAGPVGRHASAGTDWKLDTEILSYSRSKGIFAGVTLNGAWVSPDEASMVAFYGESATYRDVLLGKVPSPPSAKIFLAAVRSAEQQAKKES